MQLYTYAFNDLPLPELDTAIAVISMFQDANLIKSFKIPYDVSQIRSLKLNIELPYNYMSTICIILLSEKQILKLKY